ncbi:hypothetical protein EDC96DRAFT_606107 [Choanephora cucurbitarum]|nr:hypothetical protein EDC96DRAFT_606107 [Choanephora cucurbitarum]
MLRNKILVTSRPKGKTVEFTSLHVPNKISLNPLSTSDLKETQDDYVGVCIPYEIDTKYYTAKVDFWMDEIDAVSEKETIKAYCEKEGDISRVIDAFVFLFDKDKPDSFNTLSLWKPFLEQSDPSICLCVGTSTQKTILSMEKDVEINDWCISNGFDYVDMDETTDTPFDKVGIELALDILQTNLWDGMQKKKSKHASEHEEEEALLRDIQALKLQHDVLATSDDDWEEEDYADMPSKDEISQMREELFGDIDGEDGLDKAFEAIQAMREHGKNLSDEERRKMAAKVALSFAAQLGL